MFAWHHGGVSQPNVHHRPGTDVRPDVRGHHLSAVIGQGGSSTVWRGTDAAGHPVAVKVPHELPDPVALEQATIERHVLMAVQHDHLVGLRDVVPMPDGRVALIFDLVGGALLTGLVTRRGHLRAGEVVTVLTPLCDAIRSLHVAGGIHGDISPGNVMVTEAGRPLLLDLGAARVIAAAPGAGFGTPGFVAPEVRRGAPADARSDVFSLGALAWFCATGNGAPDTDQRLDPDTVTSHVGVDLAGVVAACIDPDPSRRPEGERLARMFYEVSRAEPVEVVLGGDDAAALTHRLRELAAGEVPEACPVSRWQALRQRMGGRSAAAGPVSPTNPAPPVREVADVPGRMRKILRDTAPHPQEAASRAEGSRATLPGVMAKGALAAESRAAGSRRGRPALLTLVAVAAVLGGAAVVSTAVASGSISGSGSEVNGPREAARTGASLPGGRATTQPDGTAVSSGSAPSRAPQARMAQPVRASDPRTNRQAPATEPKALVASLSRYRAKALSRKDDSLLTQVHLEKSPSWAADDKLIAALRQQGVTWQPLRPSVDSARLVERQGTRAVIRARVGWAAYDEVSATGTRTKRPADASAPLDLTVVWREQGWRLESVSDPPAG